MRDRTVPVESDDPPTSGGVFPILCRESAVEGFDHERLDRRQDVGRRLLVGEPTYPG